MSDRPDAGTAVPRRPQTPPVVAVLVGLNVLVYLAWQWARFEGGPTDLMLNNFMVSTQHLAAGRFWTLLTAAFSHYELWHLLLNMLVLWSFGGPLAKILGFRSFLSFYLVTAVFSSASHCAVTAVVMGRTDVPALGASGAVSGLLAVYALLFPRHRILLFGVVPVPALVGVLGFVAFDLWGLVAQSGGGGLPIGHGAHLGGSLCGALMYAVVLRPRVMASRARQRERVDAALDTDEAAEFERIRAKLSREGPQALNPKEQAFLRRIRDRVIGPQ